MKLKLFEIALGYDALKKIGGKELPIQLAWTLQSNRRILEPVVERFEANRLEIAKKYGEDKGNGTFFIPVPQRPLAEKEVSELNMVEADVDIELIDLDDISVNISPNDLYNLTWMFTVKNKPAKQEADNADNQ